MDRVSILNFETSCANRPFDNVQWNIVCAKKLS